MKIKNIKKIEHPENIYNLHVKNNNNYIAEDIVVSNCHKSKASVISSIMKDADAQFKFGFTGTLPNHPLEYRRILSYIGPVWKTYKTKTLADEGYLSQFQIKEIQITYNDSYNGTYFEIKDAIFKNDYRLKLLKHVIKNTKYTLILVDKVEEEGNFIQDYLNEHIKNKKIIFLSGKDKADIRERYRKEMENNSSLVIIATYGIFSTGINIKILNNVVLLSSSKSKIRVLQSIGRLLRLHSKKESAIIWDFQDQYKSLKKHANTRQRYYEKEEFDILTIKMNEKIDKNLNKLFPPS